VHVLVGVKRAAVSISPVPAETTAEGPVELGADIILALSKKGLLPLPLLHRQQSRLAVHLNSIGTCELLGVCMGLRNISNICVNRMYE